MPEKLQNPVIVLPGITGTSLHDEYPMKTEDLWTTLMAKEYERVSLHPDDVRYEAIEPARVVAGRAFGIIYDDLLAALRHDLSPRADRPTPVFAFPYDWRQGLARVAPLLDAMVEEVIARSLLLRHYEGYEQDPKVDLVAHSMGGLVVCEYLHQFGAKQRVGKVATLGTPYEGSVEAIVKLLTGLGNLSGTIPTEREREAARSTPAIYHLLPSFEGAVVPTGPDVLTDLFDPAAWQPGIVESLREYVRLHSVKAGSVAVNRSVAERLLAQLLGDARAHRHRVQALDLESAGLTSDRWLVVAGAGAKTRVCVVVSRERGKPRFTMSNDQLVDDFAENKRTTGDTTVPLPAAIPHFVPERSIVVVTPADFGLFELRDRAAEGFVGFHAFLPNLNLAQRLVLKHLRPAFRGDTWGKPLPGIDPREWAPPVGMNREGP